MLAEPEEQDMDDLQSNVSTEPAEDVARTTCATSTGNTCATNVPLPLTLGPRPTTSRGVQPRMIVCLVPFVCSQMFSNIFGSSGSSGSYGSCSSDMESLLVLTDATVMINNEPIDTLHRTWQTLPRCMRATWRNTEKLDSAGRRFQELGIHAGMHDGDQFQVRVFHCGREEKSS